MTAIAHVGITVPDVDYAAAWYVDVLGFDSLGPPVEVRAGEGHAAALAAQVFGARFGSFRQAHLTGSNGAAIELFEFRPPAGDAAAIDLRRPGISHLCVVPRDLEATAARIAASGGRRRTRAAEIFPGERYVTCFCEDPFGNVVELYSHGHERVYANRERHA